MTEKQTMGDVDHTHPHTDTGAVNDLFRRGPRILSDGGTRRDEPKTMRDVDHSPPGGLRPSGTVFQGGSDVDR